VKINIDMSIYPAGVQKGFKRNIAFALSSLAISKARIVNGRSLIFSLRLSAVRGEYNVRKGKAWREAGTSTEIR